MIEQIPFWMNISYMLWLQRIDTSACNLEISQLKNILFISSSTCVWHSFSDLNVADSRMISEWWTGKNFLGSGHGLIKILSWQLCEGTEQNHEKLRITSFLATIQTWHLQDTSAKSITVSPTCSGYSVKFGPSHFN